MNADAIPIALKECPQWVLWKFEESKDGRPTKVLYTHQRYHASSTDARTWLPFDRALATYEHEAAAEGFFDGIGFVVTRDDAFVGVDLDHCIRDGKVLPWAREIVTELDCYTEVTPSGEGLRIFTLGTLPPGRRKKILNETTHEAVEVYEWGRFLTVTGEVARARGVEERTEALAAMHARFFGRQDDPQPAINPQRRPIHLADVELLAKMRGASNGDAVWSLWQGDIAGYGSRSEADLALCSHLAFWTGGSPARVDQLFRQSSLMRDKWDERRGELTYGQKTIQRVLGGMTDFYDPENATDRSPRIRLKPRPGEPTPVEDAPFETTDLGNAQRLIARYGHALRYCFPWNKWLSWDGARWRVDDTGAVMRCAKNTTRAIYQEAAEARDAEQAKALAKHAVRTQADGRLRAMIELAQSEPEIPVVPEHLDADPWLLCVQNGVIDLRTGHLMEHDRELLITKVAPVSYDPYATCPTWERFLDQIMGGNEALVTFLQRAIGYSLTGNVGERCLFILHGSGRNGKSTLLEAIRALLGDYAMKTPTDTLLAKNDNGIPNDVARLKGARFVAASESDQGRRMAESLVKSMTGGDTLSARFMRGEWFDFQPEFKLWLGTNHKPVIKGTDKGIWDRIRLIPFEVRIPEAEEDKGLAGKLRNELAGILAWAVRGCVDWQREGLGMPDKVRKATAGYRAEMDILEAFMGERCVLHKDARASAKSLYAAYRQWCEANGEKDKDIITQRTFGTSLREKNFVSKHMETGDWWLGIGVRSDQAEPLDTSETEDLPFTEPSPSPAEPSAEPSPSQPEPSEPLFGFARERNISMDLTGKSVQKVQGSGEGSAEVCRGCGMTLRFGGLGDGLCGPCHEEAA